MKENQNKPRQFSAEKRMDRGAAILFTTGEQEGNPTKQESEEQTLEKGLTEMGGRYPARLGKNEARE